MNNFLKILYVTIFITFGLTTLIWAQDIDFKKIELDSFIEYEKETIQEVKRKMIKIARPISFNAKMKRYPEKKTMTYVYTAMEIAGMDPLPEVNHRMFIETKKGRIIPVYVEKSIVTKLRRGLSEEEKAIFLGYHVYSYAKGPAILVVDFATVK